MKKVFFKRLVIAIAVATVVCGSAFGGGQGDGGSEEAAKIGEYPRAETLVLYMHGRNPNPEQMNMYLPGNAYSWLGNLGGHNMLWQVNTDKGATDFWLATGYEYASDYKSMTIFLREDVKWSDGETFDASDVVFTFETLLENSTMSYAAAVIQWVSNVAMVDKYTVRLDFKDVNPRFTISIFSAWGMSILPEHVWKDENPLETLGAITEIETVVSMQEKALEIHVEENIKDYILKIVKETRVDNRLMLGVSPRGSLALFKGSQALAALRGRDYVVPEDVKDIAHPVLAKRVLIKSEFSAKGLSEYDVIEAILGTIEIPGYKEAG